MNQRVLVGTLIFSLGCSNSSKPGGGTGVGGLTGGTPSGGSTGAGAGGSIGAGGTTTGGGGARAAGGATGAGGAATGAGGGAVTGSGGATGGGTGGTPGSGGGGGAPASTGSVLERNNHPSRDGHFVQPALTKAAAVNMAPDTGFPAAFNGNTWASPLYIENGPGGLGAFIVVTTGNDVIALHENGTPAWTRSIGTPSTSASNGCGIAPINPLGILSTPVIDGAARTIYAAGAIGSGTTITGHIATAIAVEDGSVRPNWPVNLSSALGFVANDHNQRSALSLVGGILYVAYGGFVGDCRGYHGRVAAINTATTPPAVAGFATLGQGEGIWASGGLASDGTSVFAVTGNSTVGATNHTNGTTDTEEVVRLTGMAALARNNQNLYYPNRWQTMDQSDLDFGASNPVFVSLAGYTPTNYVLAIAKDGHFYFLDSANLGGANGHKVDFQVASIGAAAMSIRTVPTVYKTAKGTHIAFSVGSQANCANGMTGPVIMSVLVPPAPAGATVPVPQVEWCAAQNGATAPISTTTDGQNNALVWYVSNNRLVAVDGDTGASVFSGGTGMCTAVRQWTSPIAVKGRILAAGDGHLCSWSPH
jgi:hypothetical protein